MNRIVRIIKDARSRLYYSRPVYIPGYEYSPWKKWVIISLTGLVILLIIAAFIGDDSTPTGSYETSVNNSRVQTNDTQQALHSTKIYKVTRVIDGDTIDVSIDGKTERLRLIGIDTPETKDPRKSVQCFGKEASNKAHELLQGKRVRLERDDSQSNRDKYDRLLRYVYLEDGRSYNKLLISQGYAHEYTYNSPYKYQQEYKDAQKKAEKAQSGLWSPKTCDGSTEQAAQTITPKLVPASKPVAPVSSSQSSNCDLNYSPCIPNVSYDLDCGDISTNVRVVGTDVHRFDRDGDGYGCESN